MKRSIICSILSAVMLLGTTTTASADYLVDQNAGTIIWYDESEFDKNGNWQSDHSKSEETYYDLVLENNLEKRDTWLNPGDFLEVDDKDFCQLSDQIVDGITDDYEKLQAIHDWVCENIYYDYESYTVGFGFGPVFYTNNEDDLQESQRWQSMSSYEKLMEYKRGVCGYYTRIFETLTRAQGIPCISVSGLAIEQGWTESNYSPDRNVNHAWNEAYVDGRWIIIDTTWDTSNRYTGDRYIKGSVMQTYFDMPLERFSRNHKIVEYAGANTDDIPSQWAKDTVADAIADGIVPYTIQNSYKNEISRKEFCQLMVQLLSKKYPQIMDTAVNQPSPFSDVNDISVTLANQLGIVSGTGGNTFSPDRSITRQEAAVILSRMAKVIGLDAKTSSVNYSDKAQIASWASEGVNTVTSLGIMSGSGNNFNPHGTYTVEQAIISVARTYALFS